MKKVELLSPAGSMEALYAAIHNGADAVYVGGKCFGARVNAIFDDSELIEAIKYAHLYDVKIYVTVNTLIYDNEIDELLKYIDFLYENDVDAIIIQDIGVLDLIRKTYPDLEIHASTQMHIYNSDSLKLLKDLGVKRAVLAREVNINNIKEYSKLGIELEVFVHGALCISFSGQCLMSSLIGRRSGNRGLCAQACRLNYELYEDNKKIDTKGEYLLSPKDLNSLENIKELIESGITSFKIEGRLKRPEYVALVTSLYRKAIDNYYNGQNEVVSEENIVELQKIFNREFTKGHLYNERGFNLMNPYRPNHMGVEIGEIINVNEEKITVKLSKNINQGDGVRIIGKVDTGFMLNKIYKNDLLVNKAYAGDVIEIDNNYYVNKDSIIFKTSDIEQLERLQQTYKNSTRKVLISAEVEGRLGKSLKLILTDNLNNKVIKESEIKLFEAINQPLTKERLTDQINKLGNTPYYIDNIKIDIDNNVMLPIKEINEIRRLAIEELSNLRMKRYNRNNINEYKLLVSDYKDLKPILKVLVRTEEQIKASIEMNVEDIYVMDKLLYNKYTDKCPNIKLAVPRIISNIPDYNNQVLLVGDLGGIYKYKNKNITTEHSLNVVNSYAVALLNSLNIKSITLSYELSKEQIRNLIIAYKQRYNANPNLEMIVYAKQEMMATKMCLINTYVGNDISNCNLCKKAKKYYLKDRMNYNYDVITDNNCITYILNPKTLVLGDCLDEVVNLGINNLRLNFTNEDYEMTKNIINAYQEKLLGKEFILDMVGKTYGYFK
jgi:U32 family peptidase